MAAMTLTDGSRVAVVGGGPAGSFFCCFAVEMSRRAGLDLEIDLYEPKDYERRGPAGCNHCGGVVSESLVQALAVEGVNLPPSVVQRGIDSYVLHMDVGRARIDTPLQEKRIAAMIRGAGPKGAGESRWQSFDGYLHRLVAERGVRLIREKVVAVETNGDRPRLTTTGGEPRSYDLVVMATGVNAGAHKLFEGSKIDYQPPTTTKTVIREYHVGEELIEKYVGSSMHVFLLDVPRLEFAALIPKGDHVTVCMLGHDIDQKMVEAFLSRREVSECMPPGWSWEAKACLCSPRMNVAAARRPFADRLVFVGDCGVARLYKDGIGSAYRTAKAAVKTALLHGVSADDFRRHFWPECRAIRGDNSIGRLVFAATGLLQRWRFTRRAVLSMVQAEQAGAAGRPVMSQVLWDTFTGSAPYREILRSSLHPPFLGRLLWSLASAVRNP